MRRFSERNKIQTLAELNVTPLLDLAFVLLIIFMITTPLMDNSVDVVLPSTSAADHAVDPASVQTISMSKDGEISLNSNLVDLAGLRTGLAALRAADPGAAVVIRSHKDLPVQKLVDVMGAVQQANITKVGVVTQPEKE